MIKGVDLAQPPILDFEPGNKSGTIKSIVKSSIEHDLPRDGFQSKNYNKNFSDIIAFETRSQQCPSQMSTLQQNPLENDKKDFNLPAVANRNSIIQKDSPYIPGTGTNQPDLSDMSANNSLLMMNGENTSSTRPNTTNPVGGNPVKVDKKVISTFQHPKVGKNSKYPEVFKQNSTNSMSKNQTSHS